MTIQKLKILEYLKDVKTHPNAETIYNNIKKDVPTITLATVYRNLHTLAEEGVILKFKIDDEYRFDGQSSTHQHCVCRKCGKIIDNHQDEISRYAENKFSSDRFKPDCVNIIYIGLCSDCL